MATTIERLAVDLVANSAQFNRELRKASSTADRWAQRTQRSVKATAATFAGALGASLSVDAVTRYADSYTQVQNQIRQVTGTTEEFARANQDVLDIALETRSSLGAVATLYSRTARQADKLGLSQQQVADFTRSVNLALNAYGATAAEAASATLQLSQALAKGRLDGEEFKAVSEAAPPIIEAIARAAGKSAGELKQMGADGLISGELITRGILEARQEFEQGFARSVRSVAQAMEVAATNTTVWVGENRALQDVITTTSDAVVSLSNNLDTVAVVLEALALVYGARLLGPMVATSASMVAQGVAAQVAGVKLAVYKAQLLQTSAAAALASKAVTGLSRGLALIGGPVGAALLVAYGVSQMASEMETAEERMDRLEREALELNGALGKLSRGAIENEIGGLSSKLRDLREQLRAAREDAEKVSQNRNVGGSLGSDITKFAKANKVVSELNDEVRRTEKRISDLQDSLVATANVDTGSPGGDESGGADKINEKLDQTISSLQRQVALYGEVSEAAKLRYEIEAGAFDGSSAESQARAIELAAQLDSKRAAEKATEDAARDAEELRRAQAQNDRVVSLQQEKFARIKQAAIEATGSTVEIENFRAQQEAAQLEADLQRLRDRGLLTQDLEAQFRLAKEEQESIHQANLTEIEKDGAKERADAEKKIHEARISIYQNVLGAIAASAKEGTKIQRAALVASKLIALNEARIALGEALAKANKLGWPQNLPAIAQATSIGLGAISTIQQVSGVAHGGMDYVPKESTYLLDKGERVLSPNQNKDLTRALRGGGMGGGNVYVNIMQSPGSPELNVQQRTDDNGDVRILIAEVSRQTFAEDITGGRGSAGVLEGAYKMQRKGVA